MADNPLLAAYRRGRINLDGFNPYEPLNSGEIISTPSDSALGARGDIYPLARYRTSDGREGVDIAWPRMLVPSPGMDRPEDGFKVVAGGGLLSRFGGPVPGAVGAMRGGRLPQALDMSQEARLARAREMGFDTDRVLYKGHYPYESGGPIRNWKGEITGDDGPYVLKNQLSGFFTPDPDVATKFSGLATRPTGEIVQLFDSNAVAPVYARIKNPLVIDAKGNFAASTQFETIAKRDGMMDEYNKWKAAKDDGYDAVIIKNTKDEGDIVQVFDPSNIRSVNAAFDPAKKDSANLMAAYGGALPLPYAQDTMTENPLVNAMRRVTF